MVRWLVLLVALYIAADVSIPQMPGAVVFDPEQSVEARQSGSFWATDDVMPLNQMDAHPILLAVAERSAHPLRVARRAVRPIRPRHLLSRRHLPLDEELPPPGQAAAI